MPRIRQARASDMQALYDICAATGNAGDSALGLDRDVDLLGHLYAGPYLALEPDFAFVAEDEHGVCGYALGTPDTTRFCQQLEATWLPPLRQRYPQATRPGDAWIVSRLHELWQMDERLAEWPAHLHVDLLPRAQGLRLGGKLMQILLDQFKTAGVTGIHLGVDPSNQRALAWYPKQGFALLYEQPGCSWFVQRL